MSAGGNQVRVADIADAVVLGLAESKVVVVSVPGGCAERATDVLTTMLRGPVGRDLGGVSIVRMARTDRLAEGALAKRQAAASVNPAGITLVLGIQWADDASITALAEQLDRTLDTPGVDGRFVLVERQGAERQSLAELRLALRRRAVMLAVASYEVPDVEQSMAAEGVDMAAVSRWVPAGSTQGTELTAQAIVDGTGGAADLIDAIVMSEMLETEVVGRLAVLDIHSRSIAEALAFGADLATVGGLAPVVGGPEALDAALGTLRVEGLVAGEMPPWIAEVTRRACTPARRHAVVEQLVEHGPAGIVGDIAAALEAVGDRTPLAADLYLQHATALAVSNPATARHFADAAAEGGAATEVLASIAALGALADGDPIAALRELHDQSGPDIELMRATAWSALGDLDAAAEALTRSSTPLLAQWAATGSGTRGQLDGTASASVVDDGPGAPLVRALDAWLGRPLSDGEALATLFDDLRRATVEFRTDPEAARWPVSPDVVAVLIAARLGASDVALRVAVAAVNERPGGEVHRLRHRLIAAWLDARRGVLDAAAEVVQELADSGLAPHDRFLLEAVRCTVAVRDQQATDVEASAAAAATAAEALGPNLYLLDLLTDVAAAAERCRVGRGAELFGPVERAVEGLGAPERARLDLAIAKLRAAMASDDLDSVRRQAAAALTAVDGIDPQDPGIAGAALTSAMLVAAEMLATEDADVEVAVVVDAATRLAAAGAPHEAARLCGLVATATSDSNTARVLLKQSRNWRAARAALKRSSGADHAVVKLSEQEERVAQMVTDGHTYKQIGAVLFVSPKTVEHHVAHIRTKLGCASRAEMLAALRDYFGAPTATA